MNYIISANTDVGILKETNQDSLSIKVINTNQGKMVFSVLCDGMGGLAKGEVASATVIHAFDQWVHTQLSQLCENPIEDAMIKSQWLAVVTEENNKIRTYGARQGIRLGTTAVVMLLTQNRYYILNVGDSRAYEICDNVVQLTSDQTFVAREIALGCMTEEEANMDSRRNVLLQCIGASEHVYPDFFFGDTKKNAVYMLCSDGFRHEISAQEIFEKFQPNVLWNHTIMDQNTKELIELNKRRMEQDNISVALVRTF